MAHKSERLNFSLFLLLVFQPLHILFAFLNEIIFPDIINVSVHPLSSPVSMKSVSWCDHLSCLSHSFAHTPHTHTTCWPLLPQFSLSLSRPCLPIHAFWTRQTFVVCPLPFSPFPFFPYHHHLSAYGVLGRQANILPHLPTLPLPPSP